jgi:hypothetical protein
MINVKKHHIRRVAVLFSLGIVLIGLCAAALQPLEVLSFDSKYYLTQQQISFVRPGLKLNVQEITVTEDGSVSVTFHRADDRGLPLDLDGVFTPGPVRARFVLGTIPRNKNRKVT